MVRAMNINKTWKIRSVRRCVSNFCQDLGEASDLIMNEHRVASALDIYCTHADRIQRAHAKTNPTNVQCC